MKSKPTHGCCWTVEANSAVPAAGELSSKGSYITVWNPLCKSPLVLKVIWNTWKYFPSTNHCNQHVVLDQGVPNVSLTMYPFSISTDEHVPLKSFMSKRLIKITKVHWSFNGTIKVDCVFRFQLIYVWIFENK